MMIIIKPYLIFAGKDYEEYGGWLDWISDVGTLEEARSAVLALPTAEAVKQEQSKHWDEMQTGRRNDLRGKRGYEWAQIVSVVEKRIIEKYTTRGDDGLEWKLIPEEDWIENLPDLDE